MPLDDLLAKLYNLKRDRGSGWEKPYKPALLLALIDLIALFAAQTKVIWKLAPCLDDRLEGHKELLKLEGRSVLLSQESRFCPDVGAIQWRVKRLREERLCSMRSIPKSDPNILRSTATSGLNSVNKRNRFIKTQN